MVSFDLNGFFKQAKALADKHEEEAMKIRDTSKMAHDMAKSAYDYGKDAMQKQEDIFWRVNEMTTNAEAAIVAANSVTMKVMKAKNTTEKTLKEAQTVLDEALKPIADTGIRLIRGNARF